MFCFIRFKQLYNTTTYGIPTKYGDKYFVSIRKPEQNQAIIYSLNSLDDEPIEFLDPNILSQDGTIALKFLSFSNDVNINIDYVDIIDSFIHSFFHFFFYWNTFDTDT